MVVKLTKKGKEFNKWCKKNMPDNQNKSIKSSQGGYKTIPRPADPKKYVKK